MSYSPVLVLHISGGSVGLLSGAVALISRKGSRPHKIAGNVFFITMLTASAAGWLASCSQTHSEELPRGSKGAGRAIYDAAAPLTMLDHGHLAVSPNCVFDASLVPETCLEFPTLPG